MSENTFYLAFTWIQDEGSGRGSKGFSETGPSPVASIEHKKRAKLRADIPAPPTDGITHAGIYLGRQADISALAHQLDVPVKPGEPAVVELEDFNPHGHPPPERRASSGPSRGQ